MCSVNVGLAGPRSRESATNFGTVPESTCGAAGADAGADGLARVGMAANAVAAVINDTVLQIAPLRRPIMRILL
jgi:hypothetical protein